MRTKALIWVPALITAISWTLFFLAVKYEQHHLAAFFWITSTISFIVAFILTISYFAQKESKRQKKIKYLKAREYELVERIVYLNDQFLAYGSIKELDGVRAELKRITS